MTEFIERSTALHNKYRAEHGSPPLEWSAEMADTAKQHALSLLENPDEPLTPPKPGVFWGQNIFEYEAEGYGEISDCEAAQEAVQYWYEDGANYNSANPSETEGGRNFSQLIWRSSRNFGMAVARKADGGSTSILVLAYYDPPGNFKGQFEANVVVSGSIQATIPSSETSSSTQMQIQQSSTLVTTGTGATNQKTESQNSTTSSTNQSQSTSDQSANEQRIVAVKSDQKVETGSSTNENTDESLIQATSNSSFKTTTKTTKTMKTTTMITGGSTTTTIDGQTVTQPNVAQSSVISTTETKIDGRTGSTGTGTQKITTVTTRTTVQGSVGNLSGVLGGQDLLSMISNLVKSATGSSGRTTKTTTTITATIKGTGVGSTGGTGGGQDLAAALREALACSGFTVEEEEDEEGSEVNETLAICDGQQQEVTSSVKGTLATSSDQVQAAQASGPIVEEPDESAAEAERRLKSVTDQDEAAKAAAAAAAAKAAADKAAAEKAVAEKAAAEKAVAEKAAAEKAAAEKAAADKAAADKAAADKATADKAAAAEAAAQQKLLQESKQEVKPEPAAVEPEVKEPEVVPQPEPVPEPEVPAEPKIEPTLAPMTEEAVDLAAKWHNELRAKHGAPSVKVIDTLCQVAQGFAVSIMAKKLEDECTEGSCTGLNVYHFKGPAAAAGGGGGGDVITQQEVDQPEVIRSAVKNWMSTITDYNWRDPMASGAGCQEFAQFVWAKSRSVGFGLASNGIGSEAVFVVVYAPPADYSTVKLFRANVRPDLS